MTLAETGSFYVVVVLMMVRAVLMIKPDSCSTDCTPEGMTPKRRVPCSITNMTKYSCGSSTPRVIGAGPSLPRNLVVEDVRGSDNAGVYASFRVSFNPPDDSSIRDITGFEISFNPTTPVGSKICRHLNLTGRLTPLDTDVTFSYPQKECMDFIKNIVQDTEYEITVINLPRSASAGVGPTLKTNVRSMKVEDVPYKWRTQIAVNRYPSNGGTVNVQFRPAPVKYHFSNYTIELYPPGKKLNSEPFNLPDFEHLCPDEGTIEYTIRIRPSATNKTGDKVCVDEHGDVPSSGCLTTYRKFNVKAGDPDICPQVFPLIEVISGVAASVIVLLIIIIAAILIWNRNRDTSYGSTGETPRGTSVSDGASHPASANGHVYLIEGARETHHSLPADLTLTASVSPPANGHIYQGNHPRQGKHIKQHPYAEDNQSFTADDYGDYVPPFSGPPTEPRLLPPSDSAGLGGYGSDDDEDHDDLSIDSSTVRKLDNWP